MDALLSTLPGDIPGLLRRASPVQWSDIPRDHEMYRTWPMVVRALWSHGGELLADLDAARSGQPLSECALDLTDPTGRAHAAAWLHSQRDALALSGLDDMAMRLSAMCGRFEDMAPTDIDTLARLVLRLAGRTS